MALVIHEHSYWQYISYFCIHSFLFPLLFALKVLRFRYARPYPVRPRNVFIGGIIFRMNYLCISSKSSAFWIKKRAFKRLAHLSSASLLPFSDFLPKLFLQCYFWLTCIVRMPAVCFNKKKEPNLYYFSLSSNKNARIYFYNSSK